MQKQALTLKNAICISTNKNKTKQQQQKRNRKMFLLKSFS